ncbi:CEPT1 [Branchiostoma lanceolatum]|uniref:CEPT1 protein n=1 Tax=Branchiostoma lanceolatum TaxID=7740 RepID=A0A8K0EP80_BRALA|nr:CEPT1 [Branchiostoma lanceolatum]
MTPVLSEAQLKRLEVHKYSVSGVSVTQRVLQVLWSWLVEKLPMWVAPNLLTMAGFVLNVVTSLLLICHAPTAKEEAPVWVYMSCALGVFLYQTLDGMDGKQARRTGILLAVATACATKVGQTPDLLFFMIFLTSFVFYCTHWETYVTGTMQPGVLPVAATGLFATVVVTLWKVCGNFRTILREKTSSGGSLSPGVAILFPICVACIIYGTSSSHLFLDHSCLFLLMFGLAIAKVTNKLIVAHITKSEMTLLDSSMFGPGVLLLSQCCGGVISEHIVLWACLIYVTADLALYCFSVCDQICDHLDIYCFSITSKPSQRRY